MSIEDARTKGATASSRRLTFDWESAEPLLPASGDWIELVRRNLESAPPGLYWEMNVRAHAEERITAQVLACHGWRLIDRCDRSYGIVRLRFEWLGEDAAEASPGSPTAPLLTPRAPVV